MSAAWTVEDDGGVRVLRLVRPPGNALGLAELSWLAEQARRAGAESSARALVLASGLPRYFSSGLDLDELLALPEARRPELFEALLGAYRALLECPKPVVAAASGSALLGGWILALGCDWRVLADGAKIALSEVKLGLSPTRVLLARVSALSADPRAVKELVLRGASLRAAEAHAAGLVDELAPEAEVEARARDLARRLARSAPAAYAAVKASLNAPFLDAALWREGLAEFRALLSGAEAREGLAAMREKRRPRWEA